MLVACTGQVAQTIIMVVVKDWKGRVLHVCECTA
jgi:hypothetical protein